MNRFGSVVITVCLAGGFALPAFAQPPRPRQQPPAGVARPLPPTTAPQPQPGDGMTPGEVQRMFDAWVLVQAQDTLQLSDAQYGKFVPRLKALQDARRRHQQARVQIINELRRLTMLQAGATPDEAAIRERLKALRDEEDRTVADVRKGMDGVDEVLDVAQQGRFRAFEERMEARKLELLMRARANVRRRAGSKQ